MGLETLMLAAGGSQVAGSTLSAYGQYESGLAQEEAYDYNADVAEQTGKYEEKASRERLKKLLGTQRSLYGKAGVDLTSGSPLLLMAETAEEGEREALNIRRKYQSESALNKFYGKQAKRAGIMSGISTFMTGLGSAGTSYAGATGK